ncbi:MAG TPA: hypothetical protein EYN67_19330 [Flavobacteriales bacterium]|nr:hypothetical protein [Methylococcaceae bacterium]HHZ97640.1 hypothetical protein [Flavobacteriales bacterium]
MAIKTIGSTGDYPSPQLWEASRPAILTEPETARMLIESFSSLTDVQKTFDINLITSAINFITIEADAGAVQDFKADSSTIPFIPYGRGGTYGILTLRQGCDHLKFRNITIQTTSAISNLVLDVRTSIASDSFIELDNVYYYSDGIYGTGETKWKVSAKGHIKNSIINSGVTGTTANASDFATDMVYENITAFGNQDATSNERSGLRRNNGTGITNKCAVFNYGPISGHACYLTLAPTFTDNASSDNSGNTGLQSLVFLEQYTDPLNHDWSFKAGNSIEGAATGGADIGVIIPTVSGTANHIFQYYYTRLRNG